jgi:hypothetical protein
MTCCCCSDSLRIAFFTSVAVSCRSSNSAGDSSTANLEIYNSASAAGFNVESVEKSENDEAACIIMSFTAPNSTIIFTQTIMSERFSCSVTVDAQQVTVKKVQIDKYEGNLIAFKDGSASFLWITDDHIMCEIFGDISPDQALEMANSIK